MTGSRSPDSIAEQGAEQLVGRMSILTRQRADHERLARSMARARVTENAGGSRTR
jgi:hypothetical protein